jgi:hypothetical protein
MKISENGLLVRGSRLRPGVLEIEPPFGDQTSHLVNIFGGARHVAEHASEISDQEFPVTRIQVQPRKDRFSLRWRLNAIRSRIGQEVPLSNRYVRGQRAILVSVDGETATLQFPNGATLAKVPLRDLVDDSGYWKS